MAIYIYARVSQDESTYEHCGVTAQAKFGQKLCCSECGAEIDTSAPPARIVEQQSDCAKYAFVRGLPGDAYLGWDVTSAAVTKFADRPSGRKLMARLQQGDHVVVAKLDRMFRNVIDCCQTVDMFTEMGVSLHIIGLQVDTGTAMGRFFLQVMAAAAEMEVSQQSERRRARAQHLKTAGMSTGNNPFGFRTEVALVGDKREKRLVPCEPERELLRELLKLKSEGYNREKMTRRIERSGFRSRRGTTYGSAYIRKLLTLAMDWQAAGWDDEVLMDGFYGRGKE